MTLVLLLYFGLASAAGLVSAQNPMRDSGDSVTGAYEGWFKNPDGTYSLLIGYFNRNMKEELDIPVGPNNRIEPGGPDRGQPTHFLPRRQWGVFTITVPKDFGTNKLTWTLTANGKTTVIPANLDPLWEISPLSEEGVGNTPPTIRFPEAGQEVQGPRPITVALNAAVANPLALNVVVADDAKALAGRVPRTVPVTVSWGKFRGPGNVAFTTDKPAVEKTDGTAAFTGKAATSATFTAPGEYILRVVANDWSGDGGRGFQCCWTNAMVKVTVK